MRLVFPAGEHAPVDLADGVTRVGSDPQCAIVLAQAGVAPNHCEIALDGGDATVRTLDERAATVLNGRQIDREAVLKPGDLLLFGRIGCSVGSSQRDTAPAPKPAPAADDGRTRVRATLPRLVLRGVSGATLGKTFAVADQAVIGRQPDCDIPIPAEEISRHHARLKLVSEGVHVEDLGSANGSFINNQRIQSGLLKPGDELRLDNVRFVLLAPGMDARQQSARAPAPGSAPPSPVVEDVRRSPPPLLVIGLIALVAIAFVALRYFGVV